MEQSYKFLGSQGNLETNIKIASTKVVCFVALLLHIFECAKKQG